MFFDIQVNGAFGVDFNDRDLNLDELIYSVQRLSEVGTKKFFLTIITDSIDGMVNQVRKIVALRNQDRMLENAIVGLHIEGPFLSPLDGFRGTHPRNHIQLAAIDSMQRLMDSAEGLIRLVTIAPEMDPDFLVIRYLTEQGIRVFGGHTDASLSCLQSSISAGLFGFTHLGNGCSNLVSRHDNIINRVLSLRDLQCISVIADGIHVPFWLLKTWGDTIGWHRMIVTSDSISAAGMPPGDYWVAGQPIRVDSMRRTQHRDHSYLAGSASTLHDMYQLRHYWFSYNTSSRDSDLFAGNAERFFDPKS